MGVLDRCHRSCVYPKWEDVPLQWSLICLVSSRLSYQQSSVDIPLLTGACREVLKRQNIYKVGFHVFHFFFFWCPHNFFSFLVFLFIAVVAAVVNDDGDGDDDDDDALEFHVIRF